MFLNQKKFIYEMKNNYTKGLQWIFLIVNLFQFNFHFNFFFFNNQNHKSESYYGFDVLRPIKFLQHFLFNYAVHQIKKKCI